MALENRDSQLQSGRGPAGARRAGGSGRRRRVQSGALRWPRRAHGSRARSDAPRDASVHPPPASARSEGPARGAGDAEDWRGAALPADGARRRRQRDARRGPGRDSVRLGQRVSKNVPRRAGFRDRRRQRHEPRLPGVRGFGRVRERVVLGRRRLGMAQLARRSASALLGAPSRCCGCGGECGT